MKEYKAKLGLIETEEAIKFVKDHFERQLAEELELTRVSAPLFLRSSSGLNDNLNGVERPVSFDILETGEEAEVVHSLAKWKRHALGRYGFAPGKGLYTDMNAIRRDEMCDAVHSLYVDQWDWEKVIGPEDRTPEYLRTIVRQIYSVILRVADMVAQRYPDLPNSLPREIHFVTAQQLEDEFPALTPHQREDEAARRHGAIFLIGIGAPLRQSGKPHDGRAPDYDDWALNGDIIIWNPLLSRAFELSSMGIRVDSDSLQSQLEATGEERRLAFPFHRALVAGELPLTVGGGIGQSRLCMFMLQKAHIGEVHSSVWPKAMIDECQRNNIFLL